MKKDIQEIPKNVDNNSRYDYHHQRHHQCCQSHFLFLLFITVIRLRVLVISNVRANNTRTQGTRMMCARRLAHACVYFARSDLLNSQSKL